MANDENDSQGQAHQLELEHQQWLIFISNQYNKFYEYLGVNHD